MAARSSTELLQVVRQLEWEEDPEVHPKPAPARHQIAPKLLLKILTQIGENPVNDTYPRGENFFKPRQGLLSVVPGGAV